MPIKLLISVVFSISNLLSPEQEPTVCEVSCSETECIGYYKGPEFINGSDVAHQLSNNISNVVGDKLKDLYNSGSYSKVDLSNIIMSAKGMGLGTVEYQLVIPFVSVNEKCDAYTSFDHVGGWNHTPALDARKRQLSKALLPEEELDISNLNRTSEGLQEYWIQWKNKVIQAECVQK